MAYKDKDQPVAFIYTNLYQLFNKIKKEKLEKESFNTTDKTNTTLSQKIFSEVSEKIETTTSTNKNTPNPNEIRTEKLQNLKNNLGKLSQLHTRLQTMLELLSKVKKTGTDTQ